MPVGGGTISKLWKRDHWTFTDRPTNNCRTNINISNYVSSWLFWLRKHQTCMGCTTWFTRIPHIKQRESESAFPALLEPYGKIAPVDQVGTVVHTSRSLVPLALLMAKDERPGGHGKMGPSWSVHQFCYWTKYYVDLRFLCSYTMLQTATKSSWWRFFTAIIWTYFDTYFDPPPVSMTSFMSTEKCDSLLGTTYRWQILGISATCDARTIRKDSIKWIWDRYEWILYIDQVA